jgi:DNA adenine methylase
MLIRPPVKWHGGKRYLAKRIIKHFPEHRVYLEPFGANHASLPRPSRSRTILS